MLILYKITIPETLDQSQFIEFLKERYFPAVHRGPTRVGQITGLHFLHAEANTDGESLFYLLIDFDGLAGGQLRVDDDSAQQELEKFGAVLTHVGVFDEIDVWREKAV